MASRTARGSRGLLDQQDSEWVPGLRLLLGWGGPPSGLTGVRSQPGCSSPALVCRDQTRGGLLDGSELGVFHLSEDSVGTHAPRPLHSVHRTSSALRGGWNGEKPTGGTEQLVRPEEDPRWVPLGREGKALVEGGAGAQERKGMGGGVGGARPGNGRG